MVQYDDILHVIITVISIIPDDFSFGKDERTITRIDNQSNDSQASTSSSKSSPSNNTIVCSTLNNTATTTTTASKLCHINNHHNSRGISHSTMVDSSAQGLEIHVGGGRKGSSEMYGTSNSLQPWGADKGIGVTSGPLTSSR